MPSSRRHLLGTGREAEARKVVSQLNSLPEDDITVIEIIEELEYGICTKNEGGKATWMECFLSQNMLWKWMLNGMMLQFIQQLNCQNFYYYYSDTFFQSVGTTLDPYSIQAILRGISVVGTVPMLYLIETWGRRNSLLTSAIMEATCSIVAGLVGHFTLAPKGTPIDQLSKHNQQGGDTMIAFAVLHVFSFSIFWGPMPWVYLGKSFLLRVHPKAIMLSSATNWIWNFLLSFFTPRIAEDIGPLILLIFFGMLVFGFMYVYLFIPETKGLSLEEVDELYHSSIKPWNLPSWHPAKKHIYDHIQSEEVCKVKETGNKEST